MDFRILGELEACDGGVALDLGGPRERALLAVLLLNANELMTTDQLVDELWGESPPKTAAKTVQVYVSRMRKRLGPEAILTRPPGYVLSVDPDQIDMHRFERLAGEGRKALSANEAEGAGERLHTALSLWRGAPLADFAYEPFAQPHAARLEELRLTALEDRVEADLRRGRATELVGELQGLAARHPLRERLRGQLMLALYRSGRQADALDVYRDTRTTLVEELGIEPSRQLQDLELAMLNQDPALEPPRARPAPRAAGIFVGRDEELRSLLRALEQAQAGEGSVHLIAGEPGIGKSRLADELVAHGRDRDIAVLRGRCWEAGGAPGYWPWIQVLRAYIRAAEPDELRRRLALGAPELAELLPELRGLGELPGSGLRDPQARRFRLFDAVAGLLSGVAEERPLLLVLDDLHAADEPSLLLLQFIAGVVPETRMVVVGAYRDTEIGAAEPGHPLDRLIGELARERAVERIALPGLRRDDVADYVEESAGRQAADAVVDSIHQITAGNPLFVAETVRLLSAEDRLDRVAGEAVMPAGVREAIELRLERLPEATRAALRSASVLGREFDPALLERLCPDEDIGSALDQAIATRLITAAPGTPGLLRFSHELVRDALYERIPAARRRDLHRRVAAELVRRHAADPGPQLAKLAQHFFAAASMEEAGLYAERAAERAAAQLAYEEAARLYRLALRALEVGETTDPGRLCDLLLGLGDAQARAGEESAVKETFLRAAEVARDADMAERLGHAALGYGGRWVWTVMRDDDHIIPLLEEAIATLPEEDSALRARLLARLAAGPLKGLGDASRARRFELSAEAVAIARRLEDPPVLAWALDGRKVAIWGPDTLEEHWAVIGELLELAKVAGDPELLVDGHICALIMLVERLELNRFDTEYARAARAARELSQPGQRWLVAVMAPIHALLVGRLDDAERLIDEAFELGREAAPWNASIARLLQRFVLRGLQGRVDEVEEGLRSAAIENPGYPVLQAALASLYSELGDTTAARGAFEGLAGNDFAALAIDEEWLLSMALLTDACAFLEDCERAAILWERIREYPTRNAVGPIEIGLGSVARPLGKLAATLGRTDEAIQLFEHAAAQNDRAGATPWAAHARLDCARLQLAQGKPAAAEILLGRAAAGYRSVGMDSFALRCESAGLRTAAPPAV